MLHENREEALDRPEERTVDHDRPVALVVGADVLHVEALRHLEVELNRRELPGTADRVPRLHRDLRAVERSPALVHDQLQAHLERGESQGFGGLVPLGVGTHRLALGLRGELEIEVFESVLTEHVEHEDEQRPQLVAHLLLRAEDVRVVLGHAPHTREPVHHARLLVAVDADPNSNKRNGSSRYDRILLLKIRMWNGQFIGLR